MTIPGESDGFRYPSEDEYLVRRLGSAVLKLWGTLPPETRENIRAQAGSVWDREFGVSQLPKKLEAFVRRHGGKTE